MKTEEIRAQFPGLTRKVYGKRLVYLDNAATSQKPLSVLQMQDSLCRERCGNVHRGVHRLSIDATAAYEEGRRAVRDFIGARSTEEIIFTSGTTASFNLLAHSFVSRYVGKGDKILISEAEHHSNIVPWQLACAAAGATIDVVRVDDRGVLDMDDLSRKLDGRVKLLSITQISNVLGVINPIREIISAAHAKGIPVAVDGAQGIVHLPVDVTELDCDFYAFSGHKIYAPTGIGVLYGKKEYLQAMPPYMGGGDMVDTVTFEKTTYAPLPLKFEAGTPNFVAASCLKPALEFAAAVNSDEEAESCRKNHLDYLMDELQKMKGLHIFGNPETPQMKAPVISFTVDGTHPSDLAQLMDKMGIAVRSGMLCAEPVVRRFSETGMVRVSLAPYNTMEECRTFTEGLAKAVKMLI